MFPCCNIWLENVENFITCYLCPVYSSGWFLRTAPDLLICNGTECALYVCRQRNITRVLQYKNVVGVNNNNGFDEPVGVDVNNDNNNNIAMDVGVINNNNNNDFAMDVGVINNNNNDNNNNIAMEFDVNKNCVAMDVDVNANNNNNALCLFVKYSDCAEI